MTYLQEHDGESWKRRGSIEGAARFRVDGGWIYHAFGGPVFVPEFEAGELVTTEHVRDDRRLKLREGWKTKNGENLCVYHCPKGVVEPHPHTSISEDRLARSFTAVHSDGSETDHATRLEAHDALIASGSESPFAVVTGPAVAKVEGGAS
jgi:hypothetical protein